MASNGSSNAVSDHKANKGGGLASVLALGTANPPNVFYQDAYPDYYLRITNNEHRAELKEKLKRICKYTLVIILAYNFLILSIHACNGGGT
ncbi:putative transferase [Dioscorea sansibarensis]